MKVRLKMPWGNWSKGHVFAEMPGGQARALIDRNIAEEVKEEDRGVYVNRMMRSRLKSGAAAANV